ncbi:MAG: phosphatidylglycerophosphatase A [Blastocatellia bacterium]|nr:phosphatidylglycerophosphatase A [Blastocatellia bacterium]
MRLKKTHTPADERPLVPPKTPLDYVALVIATGLLSGYSPIAPGTAGSAVAAVLYFVAAKTGIFAPFSPASTLPLLIVIMVVSYVGVWAASLAEGFFGKKDPGHVVVDEVAGQLITYLFLPLLPKLAHINWGLEAWVVIGFFVFRAFDIIKPYPVRRLEALKGGLGIMADDILAGIQGAILMLAMGSLFY